MLMLTFQFGGERRGLTYDRIIEVVALVRLTPVGPAPPAIAGAFNYHGVWIPAVDLSQLAEHRPAVRRWSTRLIIVESPLPDQFTRPVGLIAEEATETVNLAPPATAAAETPALDLGRLLAPELHSWLARFTAPPPPESTPPPARPRRRPRHYQPGP